MPVIHKPPFDLPELTWHSVSPKLIKVKWISSIFGDLACMGVLSVVAALAGWDWLWWVVIAWAVFGVVNLFLVPRRVQAIGYAFREDDLLVRSGLLLRNLTVVPYGRMQSVEVSSGPLLRKFGLADVSLKTAASSANVTVPGLPAEQAGELRDRLSELGESRMAGL